MSDEVRKLREDYVQQSRRLLQKGTSTRYKGIKSLREWGKRGKTGVEQARSQACHK
jgi:hypothetical protein